MRRRSLATLTGDGDVDVTVAAGPEVVELRGVAVAQHGPRPDGEERRDRVPARSEPAMADGVDAAVDADEQPTRDAVAHHRRREPDRIELPPGDHAVLAIREPRQRSIP